ncbi:Wadjet anti-phage system protein JetD domain-containing protein [Prauserella sediminis]|uniref:Wadjet anti-phage system protein JetD domain-containing protein n=1 Tax=Prauserella sediminis TaxID=577680 RepID=UPI001609AF0D
MHRHDFRDTGLDQHGRSLQLGEPRPLGRLRDDERAAYLRVIDAERTGHRRIEQERIPLDRVLEAVDAVRMAAGL